MTSILLHSGFKFLQSLKEFMLKFDDTKYSLDEELEKVWICHKFCPSLNFERISSWKTENYVSLHDSFRSRIKGQGSKVLAFKIFNKIFRCFDASLATYILTECYLFYNWSLNSFEVLVDQISVHDKINELQNKKLVKVFQKTSEHISNEYLGRISSLNNSCNSEIKEKNCIKLLGSKKFNRVTSKKIKKVVSNTKPFFDIQYKSSYFTQETFDINKILYDIKLRPQWPKSHIISSANVDQLLNFIIETLPNNHKKKLYSECKKWTTYKEILREFLHNHRKVEKNNGYGRVLKRHLRKVESAGRLSPIPKFVVFAYVFDVLRKVIPVALFGGQTSLRKKFFKNLTRVLNASRHENFIWHPLLHVLVRNKHLLNWCREMNDNMIENIMILKTFKFLIMEFVFLVVKYNFYVTENGASGYNIEFYNKKEMEKVSSDFVNSLLYYQQIKKCRKKDHDPFTLERKWIETGIIDEKDLDNRANKMMSDDCEFKQPYASVRFLPKNNHSGQLRIITRILSRRAEPISHSSKFQQLETTFKNRAAVRQEKLLHTKLFLDYLVESSRSGVEPTNHNTKLELLWQKVIQLKKKFGTLFYVKADVAAAFDSILHLKLMEVLQEKVQETCGEKIQLKNITQWKIRNKKIVAEELLSFSDRPKDNAILISVSAFAGNKKLPAYQPSEFLKILSQIILGQRLVIKGKTYKLTKGLAQGSAGRFSSQLCNLYYSTMDKRWFRKFDGEDCILIREVDDYLMVTSNAAKAKAFLFLVRSGIKDFNARFNTDKLKSNLNENVDEVTFLCMTFNFKHFSVKPNYSPAKMKTILSAMRLSDRWGNSHFKKNYFLERKTLRMISLKLESIAISRNYNNVHTIRRTVFVGCIVQSTRIMMLAKHLFSGKVKNDLGVVKVIFKSYRKVKHLVCKRSGISKAELGWMFFAAVVKTFRQGSGQFKVLLLIMRFHLRKRENFLARNKGDVLISLKNDLRNFLDLKN